MREIRQQGLQSLNPLKFLLYGGTGDYLPGVNSDEGMFIDSGPERLSLRPNPSTNLVSGRRGV